MSDPTPTTPSPKAATSSGADIARNVLFNWSWYVLVLFSGLLLPRLINDFQSQEILGVWDFGWSLAIWGQILALGMASAVSRYVARHRTQADWAAMNVSITSALAWLLFACLAGTTLSLVLAFLSPYILDTESEKFSTLAAYVTFLLGFSAALQMPFAAFNSVITGFARFDILNIIRMVRDIAQFAIMLVLLALGSGLVALSLAIIACELAAGIWKVAAAKRLCPTLKVSFTHLSWIHMKEMIGFGGRSVTEDVSRAVLYQGNGLLVAYFLGPAALAIYSRQRSLVMHLMRFVKQYAHVFLPTSSSLDAEGREEDLRQLLIHATKFGFLITLPAVLILLIMGSPLLRTWMGDDFAAPAVLTIMALGALPSVSQLGVKAILVGLAKHGRSAAISAISSVSGIVLGIILLVFWQESMVCAAISMCLPMAVADGILIPAYACRELKLPLQSYIRKTLPEPLLLCVPLAICLLSARAFFADSDHRALGFGIVCGGAVTAALYWNRVIPPHIKASLLAKLTRRAATQGSAFSTQRNTPTP